MSTKGLESAKSHAESVSDIINSTKKSLSILELDTWKTRFNSALSWLKDKLGFSKIDNKSKDNDNKSTNYISTKPIDYTTIKPTYFNVDTTGFTPGDYPFAHIKTPYKGISTYRVDNRKLKPLIGFSQLGLNGTEGPLTTLQVKDQPKKFANMDSAGYKKNNPCNVSPYKGDIGRTSSSKVADGQNHAKYETMEDGLASFMKLMRQPRYRNKSIQGINCSGMQGIYNENEPDSLKALRISWITNASKEMDISPFVRLNTDDKETLMALTQQTAIRESSSYFDRATLERAYNKAFGT